MLDSQASDFKPHETFLMDKGFSNQDVANYRSIIEKLDDLGTRIDQRFLRFVKEPASYRPRLADTFLRRQPRMGLVRRGVSKPETVQEHYTSLMQFVRTYDDDRLDPYRDQVLAILAVHDLVEGITTDFCKATPVTTEEKDLLERMAAAIIFEASPEKNELFEAFESAREPGAIEEAKIAMDFDKLQAVIKAAIIEVDQTEDAMIAKSRHPDGLGLFDDFREGVEAIVQTDIGRDLLARLDDEKTRPDLLDEYRAAEEIAGRPVELSPHVEALLAEGPSGQTVRI